MKEKNRIIFACFSLFVLPAQMYAREIDRPRAQNKPARQLAVVAIPTYIDNTGSKNYGYLSPSLTDAVNTSMQEKFEYARANQSAVAAQTQSKWKANKKPSDTEIRQVAIATGSDYVVVGSYSLSANKKQIIFNTRIYIAPDKFIDVPPLANNADATLFDATNKVATEIVKAIEAEAIARAAATNQQAQAKSGEKMALSKTEATPEKSSDDSSYNSARDSDRYIGVGVGYASNVVERQAQFYQYASSAFDIHADFRLSESMLLYGKIMLPQTPSGDSIPTTFANKGNQTVGLEVGNRRGNYVFGINYRNFSDTNPAGIYQRDLLNWSSSMYLRTTFELFQVGKVYFGLDLDSYFDFLSVKKIASSSSSDTSDIGLVWNVESAVTAGSFLPVVDTYFGASVGGAYSIADTTNRPMNVSLSQDVNRGTTFVGLRFGLELSKWFRSIHFKLEAYTTPSLADKYQRIDTNNAKLTSLTYMQFSANYRFGL